jgi:hypothetical protein
MISYIKTQWWRLLIALMFLGFACYYAFQPGGDLSTLEGLNKSINIMMSAGTCFTSFLIWLFVSIVDYNDKRIELLEKKAEKYDALVDEVRALYEANRIDREHMKLMDVKINELRYTVQEELRK